MEKLFNLIRELAGEEAVPIAKEIIEGKENVSEFKIAEKLSANINQIRNLLYKLQKYNLITSTRKKDKKKGWYIYYWTFNMQHANSLITTLKKGKLDSLKRKLIEEESTEYYTCSRKCGKLELEEAMDQNFKCSDCGLLLNKIDNQKDIKAIQKEITLLEQELVSNPTTLYSSNEAAEA